MWHTLELHSYWLPLAIAIPTILLHDPAFLSHRDDRCHPDRRLCVCLAFLARFTIEEGSIRSVLMPQGKRILSREKNLVAPRIRVLLVGESEVTEGPNKGIKSHGSSASGDRILKTGSEQDNEGV